MTGARGGSPRVSLHNYDPAGELSDAFDRRRGWVQYDYDPAGRLLSVLHEAEGEERAERFCYDAAGNLYEAGDEQRRVYGPGGRLLRRGETTYTWDEAGRLVEKRTPRAEGPEVWRYSWDAAGRLASVEQADGRRADYRYDPLGRRVEAQLSKAKLPGERARPTERIRFVWDGDTLAHAVRTQAAVEGDPVVEERTFCFEDGSFVPWAQCDDMPDGFGGRRHAWAYLVNDPIGTPDELVSGDGEVQAELDRRIWGKVEGKSRAATPLRFQGQQEDEGTGLFYNRFRYYDAEAGLYISSDPIGLQGGLRAFGYGLNPTGWIDPLGLATCRATTSPVITPQDLQNKTRPELLAMANTKGLVPHATRVNKFMDPVTNKERLRLDPGHVDAVTGLPYNDPKARVPHAHGYESDGTTKIRDPVDGNPHFPIR